MRTRWTGRVLSLVTVLALVGAACGGDDEPEDGGTTQTDEETTEPTETSEPTDDGGGGTVVTANNFAFTPTEVTVASGDAITARNGNPTTPHTFTVEETDIDVSLAARSSEDVTIDLDPGEYGFLCTIHPQMTGTLTVT
jgi:plastocyanin